MKNSRVMSTALVTFAALASPAAAESLFSGGEVSLNYAHNQTLDYDFRSFSGSVAGQFGAIMSQFDLYSGEYSGGAGYNAYTLHFGYDVTPEMTAAVFYGVEDWGANYEYPFYGVEVAYETGQFAFDAAYISVRNFADSAIEALNAVQFDGTYHLNESFDLIASFAKIDHTTVISSYTGTVLGVGGRYNLTSGAFVELSAFNFDRTADIFEDLRMVEIRFGYEFGNGKAFGGRTFGDYIPVY